MVFEPSLELLSDLMYTLKLNLMLLYKRELIMALN